MRRSDILLTRRAQSGLHPIEAFTGSLVCAQADDPRLRALLRN
jgi:hypothetical protein